jgi:hypothetical protein
VGAEIHGFDFQTGSLAQLRHFSPEIEFTELLLTILISCFWVNVMLLRIGLGSVKYQFAGLTTKPTVKLPWKSQTSFKMLYNTSMNAPSPQIPGFQTTWIRHLFKNSNSVEFKALQAVSATTADFGRFFHPVQSSTVHFFLIHVSSLLELIVGRFSSSSVH